MEIARGAEAVIIKENKNVVKKRVEKKYRIKEIDNALRSRRTKSEARMLRHARRAGVATPQVLDEKEDTLTVEFIDGQRVKELLSEDNAEEICTKIGESVAKLHDYGIIHGDLTTSNMILQDKIYFIDFGLGFFSKRPEDKAVDLHLLKEALESTHFAVAKQAWQTVLNVYEENYADARQVLGVLKSVEKRGRYTSKE